MSTAELPTTPSPQTFSNVEFDTPAASAFLRRVMRDQVKFNWSDGWRCWIELDGERFVAWRFGRTIAPKEFGDPEQLISVTLTGAPLYRRGREGHQEENGHTVYVRKPRKIFLSGTDLSTACFALLSDCHLYAVATRGSLNTNKLGLSQYYLEAESEKRRLSFTIGSVTLADNNMMLTRGPVEF